MGDKKTAYRDKDKPCEECDVRRERLTEMRPFTKTSHSQCPACQETNGHLAFRIVCSKSQLMYQKGFWFLRWWGRVVWTCPIATKHFHMKCFTCNHTWNMRTAFDAEPAPADKEKK